MALASVGASTPFITSTPSSAVTLAFPSAGVGDGLGFAAAEAAAVALAGFSLAVFASLLPAIAGIAVMANTDSHDTTFFAVNMDGILFLPSSSLGTDHGAEP